MIKKIKTQLFIFSTIAIIVASCSKGPSVKIDLKDLCKNENKGKRFEVEGKAVMLTSMMVYVSIQKFCLKKDGAKAFCDIYAGEGKNHMKKLPQNFTENDFEITDNNGAIIKNGDEIRVIGSLKNVDPKYGGCIIDIDEVYKK